MTTHNNCTASPLEEKIRIARLHCFHNYQDALEQTDRAVRAEKRCDELIEKLRRALDAGEAWEKRCDEAERKSERLRNALKSVVGHYDDRSPDPNKAFDDAAMVATIAIVDSGEKPQ